MNIPNILTVIRFLLVPFLAYYLFNNEYSIAIFIFLFAGFTDVLDGYLARKFNIITPFGEFADPLADKLVQATAVAVLAINQVIPVAVIVIVVLKELMMGLGAVLLYKKDQVVVPANWYGKLATVLFYVAILSAILLKVFHVSNKIATTMVNFLFLIGIFTTLFALVMYGINYRRLRILSKK